MAICNRARTGVKAFAVLVFFLFFLPPSLDWIFIIIIIIFSLFFPSVKRGGKWGRPRKFTTPRWLGVTFLRRKKNEKKMRNTYFKHFLHFLLSPFSVSKKFHGSVGEKRKRPAQSAVRVYNTKRDDPCYWPTVYTYVCKTLKKILLGLTRNILYNT
jgi:energy-coupling factor transporter transmembrane protein EcfT